MHAKYIFNVIFKLEDSMGRTSQTNQAGKTNIAIRMPRRQEALQDTTFPVKNTSGWRKISWPIKKLCQEVMNYNST